MDEDIRKKMYIKLFYSLIDWEWFHDPNTFVVFAHLLLRANRKQQKYAGDVIKRGEVLASLDFLAKDTGLSIQNVRTALKNLKSTHDITQRKIGKNAVYAIVSFNKWQSGNTKSNNELTTNQQRSNNELTTLRDCNIVESERVCEKDAHPHGRFGNVFLTDEEYQQYKTEVLDIDDIINELSDAIETDPKRYATGHMTAWLNKFIRAKHKDGKEPERRKMLK